MACSSTGRGIVAAGAPALKLARPRGRDPWSHAQILVSDTAVGRRHGKVVQSKCVQPVCDWPNSFVFVCQWVTNVLKTVTNICHRFNPVTPLHSSSVTPSLPANHDLGPFDNTLSFSSKSSTGLTAFPFILCSGNLNCLRLLSVKETGVFEVGARGGFSIYLLSSALYS